MAVFVLVSGAWHGAWCWSEVRPLLENAGHRVLTPDLPGMGADRTSFDRTSFTDWAHIIARLAAAQDEPVILVGHSRGGIVISQAAEYAPDAIRCTVYLAAMLVPNGQRMASITERVAFDAAIAAAITLAPDGLSTVLAPAIAASHFYNKTGPDLAARAIASLTPEPLFSADAILELSDQRFGRVARSYIECIQDRSVPLEAQRLMHDTLPCWRVSALDTDHSPFFSAPAELAKEFMTIDSLAPRGAELRNPSVSCAESKTH